MCATEATLNVYVAHARTHARTFARIFFDIAFRGVLLLWIDQQILDLFIINLQVAAVDQILYISGGLYCIKYVHERIGYNTATFGARVVGALHGVALSAACLPIREDSAVEAFQHVLDQMEAAVLGEGRLVQAHTCIHCNRPHRAAYPAYPTSRHLCCAYLVENLLLSMLIVSAVEGVGLNCGAGREGEGGLARRPLFPVRSARITRPTSTKQAASRHGALTAGLVARLVDLHCALLHIDVHNVLAILVFLFGVLRAASHHLEGRGRGKGRRQRSSRRMVGLVNANEMQLSNAKVHLNCNMSLFCQCKPSLFMMPHTA